MKILELVSLTQWHTFQLPSVAAKAIRIDSAIDLQTLHDEGFFQKNPFLILGQGSNTVFLSDVNQVVLKIEIPGIESVKLGNDALESSSGAVETDDFALIRVGAGVVWDDLVDWAINHGLSGVENLAGIPGTCGAAPIQNIGAYGMELSDTLHSLEAFDTRSGEFRSFLADECQFAYRESFFKAKEGRFWIITSITLKLIQSNSGHFHPVLSYKGLSEALEKNGVKHPTPAQIAHVVRRIRDSKLPSPADVPNAGSFFKNPTVDAQTAHELRQKHPDMPVFTQEDGRVKIPAGWLIEQVGWKGKMEGNVGTWKNQALVLIQNGQAIGAEVLSVSNRIRAEVGEKFGIQLEPEVNLIAEDGASGDPEGRK